LRSEAMKTSLMMGVTAQIDVCLAVGKEYFAVQ
jgi:hypothetical protein